MRADANRGAGALPREAAPASSAGEGENMLKHEHQLKVNLLSEGGRHLTSEPVTEADLAPLRSEAWFEAFVRKGMADVPFADVAFRLVPIFKADSDNVCAGFAFEADSAGGVARCEFYRRALIDVAARASERLYKFGVLEAGDQYHYEIVVDNDRRSSPAPEGAGRITIKRPPLHFLPASLRGLLKAGRAADEQAEDVFNVFFTEAALASAEKFSRQGAAEAKPIETGAALAGFLCVSNDDGRAGDFFLVVTDVLEAMHSAGAEFSLTYTSESWNRIARIMAARQSAQPAFRLCGSAHGHNFSPGEPCAACFKTAAACGSHNVVPSTADLLWTQSVFAHQPWALCQIFGRNARGETLHGLFTLRNGRFHRRGYFILPTFDPDFYGKTR